MINKTLLLVLCLLPLVSLSQTYGFNRQSIITFDDAKKYKQDVWLTPIEIEIDKKFIIMRRPPNGVGEKELVDTLVIVSKSKKTDVTKYTVKDGRTISVIHDRLVTMITKEKKSGARVEYCFYNQ